MTNEAWLGNWNFNLNCVPLLIKKDCKNADDVELSVVRVIPSTPGGVQLLVFRLTALDLSDKGHTTSVRIEPSVAEFKVSRRCQCPRK